MSRDAPPEAQQTQQVAQQLAAIITERGDLMREFVGFRSTMEVFMARQQSLTAEMLESQHRIEAQCSRFVAGQPGASVRDTDAEAASEVSRAALPTAVDEQFTGMLWQSPSKRPAVMAEADTAVPVWVEERGPPEKLQFGSEAAGRGEALRTRLQEAEAALAELYAEACGQAAVGLKALEAEASETKPAAQEVLDGEQVRDCQAGREAHADLAALEVDVELVVKDDKDVDRTRTGETNSSEDSLFWDVRKHWRRMLRHNNMRFAPVSSSHLVPDNGCLSRIAHSPYYEIGIMLLICSNALFIGVQVQYESVAQDSYRMEVGGSNGVFTAFWFIELMYMFAFVAEWLIRVLVERGMFFKTVDWQWNIFDTVVLALMLLEYLVTTLLDDVVQFASLQMLRTLRIVKVFRAIRVIRMVKFLRELRVLLQSVVVALRSLMWTAIVVSMMLYVFAIAFTQGVVDYCSFEDAWASESTYDLRYRFGSLERSILTLYQVLTAGLNWALLTESLLLLHPFYMTLFIAYVTIGVFALLNVVTGIFVETSMQLFQMDRDMQMQDELKRKEHLMHSIQRIFREMDTDHDDVLTKGEVVMALKDERILTYFNSLNLDISDVQTLFTLLDHDENGSINVDEFFLGIMKLKGEARSIDVAKLQYSTEWLIHSMAEVRKWIDNTVPPAVQSVKPAGSALQRQLTPLGQRVLASSKTTNFDAKILDSHSRSVSRRKTEIGQAPSACDLPECVSEVKCPPAVDSAECNGRDTSRAPGPLDPCEAPELRQAAEPL